MLKHLLLLVFIPTLAYCQGTNVRQCTGYRPRPHEVRVAGCSQMPCIVRRGTDALMDLDFTTFIDSSALSPAVFATVLGQTIRYPLPEHLNDACRHVGPNTCPLAAGTTTTYSFVFSVNPSYPPITIPVEVNLVNQNEVAIACFVVEIAVRF